MSGLNITVKTLLGNVIVTGIVGQRIYPLFAPQGAAMPNIVVHLIHEDDPDLLQGAGKYPESRVSVESRTAGNIPVLGTLGQAVIDAMQDKTSYAIANCIATIRKEGSDETDSSIETNALGTPDSVRRITDFYVRWRAAP